MFSGAAHRSCKYITLKNGARAALGVKIIRLFGCVPFFFSPLSFFPSVALLFPPPHAPKEPLALHRRLSAGWMFSALIQADPSDRR